ncbi:excitatory amino acid transporter-like [Haliotis rubra]|uniref:excitatory amino acid transporter-like n=1 Tax=Haliotis rubra TaxID=36100 RepID=UPI001EE5274E|nr:excitatory amino acid transporter-like [Haliotis rubra]
MKVLQFLRHKALLISTIIAVVLGIVAGIMCRSLKPTPDAIQLVQFPGELFLRMLKMLMLPLIAASIITGLGNMKGSSAGRMGVLSMVYYASTSVAATLVGLALVLSIKPGSYSDSATTHIQHNDAMASAIDIILDLMRNIVPDNLVAATVQHSRTETVVHEVEFRDDVNSSSGGDYRKSTNLSRHFTAKKTVMVDGANVIGVITYCIVFGVTLNQLGCRGGVVAQFFTIINLVTFKMITLVMWYSPVGILFLITGQIISTTDLTETGQTLAIYIATEMAGLAIHLLVVLPGLYCVLTRKNPYAIYLKAIQALITALATSSSAATLPVTMQCVEQRMKMDTRISRFILPVGATVNMDGGAVFAAIAPMFIAQYNGISLTFGDVIIIRDRFRTTVNVASDCLVVGVVSHYTKLSPSDTSETQGEPLREEQEMLENDLV